MKIAIVAATSFEIEPTLQHLGKHGKKASFFHFEYKDHYIYPLVTGVGALKTAFAMARFTESPNIDLAINAGIAGSYDRSMALGKVVQVKADRFGDIGVEEADGRFTDVYELGLEEKNMFPYTDGKIVNDSLKYTFDIDAVDAVTVNKVNGTQSSIDQITKKYAPQIESMEGAGFMYACKTMDIQHVQLRSISNYVEPRNKDGWKIELAIDNLNQSLIKLLDNIQPVQRNRAGFFS